MRSLRTPILVGTTLLVLLCLALAWWWPAWAVAAVVAAAACALAWRDALQRGDNVRRNYPGLGTLKALVEDNRQIWQQAALENNREGRPFDAIRRDLVRRRAADRDLHRPFGTEYDYDHPGHEWLLHSNYPVEVDPASLRIWIGEGQVARPYDASPLNVAGMSYGSISPEATRALVEGARRGGFAMNTGEGGLSEHHLAPGGSLVFQFGTGYFGCRTADGRFDEGRFRDCVQPEQVRMVEIKISQGAKPGYGAILPARKNTPEIARIRGIEPHTEVHSPAAHTAFHDPRSLLAFVARLRELSGRPVGIKLCLGQPHEWLALCRAMVEQGEAPDYVALDGGEGGSAAAALDSVHWVGMPLEEALVFVHDALVGFDLRGRVRLFVSGKVASSFDLVRWMALGADGATSARAMMLALGCTQALLCDTNRCPTGLTTMDPALRRGLVVEDKAQRVASFHRHTVEGVARLLGAAGLVGPAALHRGHICRRTGSGEVHTLQELHPPLEPGSLLHPPFPARFQRWLR
jgi:glutamate synthase domain-containing protein 2